jgi:hypothetical protein
MKTIIIVFLFSAFGFAGTFDVKDNWKVTSKKCNGTALKNPLEEVYKFDDNKLVRVEKVFEDNRKLCKSGYVYDRKIKKYETGSTYKEESTLYSSLVKKTCWQKKDGKVIEPGTSDIIEFGPEEMGLLMSVTGNSATFNITDSKDCAGNTLEVLLAK